MKAFIKSVLIFILVVGTGAGLFKYWPYIFARTVNGVISDVQRVAMPVAVVSSGSSTSSRDLFSFAVGIRESTGEIVTASSEDRQWAVAKMGQCAEAKFYPYPPWQFEKSGTYFGARLLKLYDCEEGKKMLQQQSATLPPASAPTPDETVDGAAAAAAAGVESANSGSTPATSGQ